MSQSGREKALETTLLQIQKRYGEGALMRMGDASTMQVESISTGSISGLPSIISEAFSAIITVEAFKLPLTISGKIEESTTRRLAMP